MNKKIIISIVLIIVVAGGAAAAYFYLNPGTTNGIEDTAVTENIKSFDSVDFNFSGIDNFEDFDLSGLGVNVDMEPLQFSFSGVGANANLDLTVPTTEPLTYDQNSLNFTVDITPPASSQPNSQPDSNGSSASSEVNASNCVQFSAVPSCSYVGDPNGQTLCNQCKDAGY